MPPPFGSHPQGPVSKHCGPHPPNARTLRPPPTALTASTLDRPAPSLTCTSMRASPMPPVCSQSSQSDPFKTKQDQAIPRQTLTGSPHNPRAQRPLLGPAQPSLHLPVLAPVLIHWPLGCSSDTLGIACLGAFTLAVPSAWTISSSAPHAYSFTFFRDQLRCHLLRGLP